MNRQIANYLFGTLLLLAVPCSYAGSCDDPQLSEEIAECLGKDLRDADENINSSYKNLMGKLNETDRLSLRQSQRAWILNRDTSCQIDSKEINREIWYQALLKDYAKTVCITRYTRQRNKELELILSKLSASQIDPVKTPINSQPATPAESATLSVAYDKTPPTFHTNGKWYFEITVDYSKVVNIEPIVLTLGVLDKDQITGTLDNVRMRDKDKMTMRYGFAVDLDNGKFYSSRNGTWINGAPDSNLGKDLKLGRSYNAAIISSADTLLPYLEQKAIIPNFGATAMTYNLPSGYSPWQN